MAELDEKQRSEEFQRKLESIRQKTLAEELARLEAFATSNVNELAAARRSESETRLKELHGEASRRKTAAEAALASLEPQVIGALQSAIKQRADARRREEELLRKKADEERIRQETARKKADEEARIRTEADEEARIRTEADQRKREEEQRKLELQKKKAEEEARLRAEAEQRKRKEEERQRAETERKKKEEEQRRQHEADQKRRQEEERHRLEEEAHKKMEEDLRRQQEALRLAEEAEHLKHEEDERQKARLAEEAREKELKERERRIQRHLAGARASHQSQNYADAAAETAKALAIDPVNAEALTLDAAIRQDQAAVTEEPAAHEKTAKPAKEPKKSREKSKKARMPVLLFVVILAGALLVGGILFFQLKKTVFPSTTTLAVLPWSAAQSGGDEILIGSSLAEEVARQFEHSPQAGILGFSTAYGLSRTAPDPVQSAFGLGYSLVLKGTVRRSGDSYTVALQLVDSMGNTSWEKSYTKSQETLAQLPSEIVLELRDVLKVPAPAGSTAPKPAANPSAYLLYLRGIGLLHGRSAQEIGAAYALFDQAATLESEFSEALAAKAEAIALSYELGFPLAGVSLEDAKKYSADAIANNPSSAVGYLARGMVFDQLKQYRMALQQFDNALQHAPSSSDAYFNKAKVHLKVGQHEEGMNALTAAFRLSPRDPAVLTLIAQTYQLARATQEGFWYHETAIQYVADSTAYIAGPVADAILTDAALTLTQADRVAAALQRVIATHPDDFRSMYRLARLYQVSGKGLESLNLLSTAEGLTKARPQDAEAAVYLALILTRQGKFPDAVPLAQRILGANPGNARIGYSVAQMYALQMYSGKTMSVDEDVKKLCTATIHDALALDYRFDELANGDFYNMYEHSDFKSIIQVPLK